MIKISNILKFLILPVIAIFLISCGSDHDYSIQINNLFSELKQTEEGTPEYKALADSAFKLASSANSDSYIETALWHIGNYYLLNNEYDTALDKFELSIGLHGKNPPDQILGDNYNSIGRVYFRMKEQDKAIANFKQAADIRWIVKDSTGYGTSLNNIGFIFWSRSQFDSAIVYFSKALTIREKIDNKENLSSTLNNIGTIYYQWSVYDKALDFYRRSLDLRKQINDISNESLMLCNIGLVYEKTNQPESAKGYFREALYKAVLIQDSQKIGYAYYCLGNGYFNSNIDSSIIYYKKSLEFYESVDQTGGVIVDLEGIGKAYYELDSLEASKKYFNEILRRLESNPVKIREAIANQYFGRIYQKEEKFHLAINYLEISNKLAEPLQTKFILVENYRYLGEIYEAMGLIDKALEAIKQFIGLNSEVENKEMQRRLTETKKQFELERFMRTMDAIEYENEKNKIIISLTIGAAGGLLILSILLIYLNRKRRKLNRLLIKTNEQIVIQKEELYEANLNLVEATKTKDKFYSIVAHDLKNPFITLYGYTEILKNEYNDLTDEERIQFIGDLEIASKKTYQLLENLLQLSSSKAGGLKYNPSQFEITEKIRAIVEVVEGQAKMKGIKIHNNSDKELSVYADSSMIETVFRNLLTNAVKFSYPGGTITISSDRNDLQTIISIADNGIGMDKTKLDNIFDINYTTSSRGTNDEKGTGLGLGICKEFVEKNKGQIWVESEIQNGATFYFSIPNNPPE